MMSVKLLNVIMPCYNVEKYIGEALESILRQTFKDFKVIVIDDNSQDKTLQIVNEYANKDNRICVYHNGTNRGAAYSRNRGLDICDSKYIAYMDADDISLNNRFEIQIDFLEKNPEIGAVSAYYDRIDAYGKIIKKSKAKKYNSEEIKGKMIFEDVFFNAIAMFRRDLVIEYGIRYNLEDKVAEDYRFWCTLSNYSNLYIMDKTLYYYRYLETSLTNVYMHDASKEKSLFTIHKNMLEQNNVFLEAPYLNIFLCAVSTSAVVLTGRDIICLKKAISKINWQVHSRKSIFFIKTIRKSGRLLILNKIRDRIIQISFLSKIYGIYRIIKYHR